MFASISTKTQIHGFYILHSPTGCFNSLHLNNDVEEGDSADSFVLNYGINTYIITPRTAIILLNALEISQ